MIYEKESLRKLIIDDNLPYERIGKLYGVSGGYIRKKAKELGIVLPKRRLINPKEDFSKRHSKDRKCLNCGKDLVGTQNTKFCSCKCHAEYEHNKKVEEWLKTPEKFTSEDGYDFIRKYLMICHHNKCEKCGWGEINPITNRIPLEVHHIDGDCTNNRIENLQLLCPNCHSLTSNFGSVNRGKSKRYKLREYKKNI